MKYDYVNWETNTTEKKMRPLTFSDLKDGDLFTEYPNAYLYIKCTKDNRRPYLLKEDQGIDPDDCVFNAIRLDDGRPCLLEEDQGVDLYNGVITLNTNDFVSEIKDN